MNKFVTFLVVAILSSVIVVATDLYILHIDFMGVSPIARGAHTVMYLLQGGLLYSIMSPRK